MSRSRTSTVRLPPTPSPLSLLAATTLLQLLHTFVSGASARVMSPRRRRGNRIRLVTGPGEHLGEQQRATTMMTVLLSAMTPLLRHHQAQNRPQLLTPAVMSSVTDGSRHHSILDMTTPITNHHHAVYYRDADLRFPPQMMITSRSNLFLGAAGSDVTPSSHSFGNRNISHISAPPSEFSCGRHHLLQ